MTDTQAFRNISLGTKVKIAWGFFWRGLAMTLASTLAGVLAGAIIGIIASLNNFLTPDTREFSLFAGGVGLLIGIYSFWLYMHWLFQAKISGFRLRLERS